MESAEPVKVMIWAKTYPELSRKYRETVCTAGCLEDGSPIRIYPVPLRYLPGVSKYRLYDWIEVPLRRNPQDSRPESFRIATGVEPRVVGHVRSKDGWRGRMEILSRKSEWHFDCATALHDAQQDLGTSLGMISVREVVKVEAVDRDSKEREGHERSLEARKQSIDMFAGKGRNLHLDFIPWRFRVHWRCEDPACDQPHTASVLDWGLNNLARTRGRDAALAKLRDICDLEKHSLQLFLGNLNSRRRTFSIVGLWYPLLAHQAQGDLFTP